MNFRSLVIFFVSLMAHGAFAENINVYSYPNASNRVVFGTDVLTKSLKSAGYKVEQNVPRTKYSKEKTLIVIEKNDPSLKSVLKKLNIQLPDLMKKEGFYGIVHERSRR